MADPAAHDPAPVERRVRRIDDAMFRSLIDLSPAYFYLAEPTNSKTLYRSRSAERMLGWTSADWAANPDLWTERLHPEDRDRVLNEFMEAGRGGPPFRCEYRLVTKDGSIKWLRDHAVLVDDPGGAGKILMGVVLDITDQVAAEDAARVAQGESEAKSRFIDTVFIRAPLGVARVDVEMRVVEANPRLRGLLVPDGAEMTGRLISDFLSPEEFEKVFLEFRPLWLGEVETIESDSNAIRSTGQSIWLHWTATTVRRPDGRIDYFLVMFEDVTARHAAEAAAMSNLAELDRTNRLKSEFISIVSHEFRTALTGIQGFSEILRDTPGLPPADVSEFAGDIHKDALRLNRMITEMLDLDRMESGKVTLNMGEVDLNALVADALERARATSRLHRFKLDLDAKLRPLTADSDRVFQVLTNLISNAIKYSPKGGEITVETAREAGGARVSVRDQGLGMPEEFLKKVFDRYERYESTSTKRIVGTGLGLPISRQIVELHRGRIWVESKEGVGSTFNFWLPGS